MKIKQLYINAIHREESTLAHYLHHLIKEQKISLEDNITNLDFEKADHDKVAKMIENNILGFHKIHVYSLKMNKTTFVFIFAASREEAIEYYTKTFKQRPLNCHEYPLDFELQRGNGTITFRKLRRETTHFPAIAGHYTRKQRDGSSAS
ncbi:hypothetical protein [Metabacillus malikii]|uniref:Uncharacterized protein n=1 Tax=Metabacillus malikii TaxID=1504265 RepID=A0ABT9ZK57_9BACI|nr:hypothetical protein [Metabacillus malikii]MDQ0232678.1 hypothetical protein [Metabacillus malikii]